MPKLRLVPGKDRNKLGKANAIGTQGAPLLMPVMEAARMLGISRSSIYELFKANKIKCVRLGSRRLIERKALEHFITRKTR